MRVCAPACARLRHRHRPTETPKPRLCIPDCVVLLLCRFGFGASVRAYVRYALLVSSVQYDHVFEDSSSFGLQSSADDSSLPTDSSLGSSLSAGASLQHSFARAGDSAITGFLGAKSVEDMLMSPGAHSLMSRLSPGSEGRRKGF